MAFPLAPATNDTHTEGGVTFEFTGSAWIIQDQSGAGGTDLAVANIGTETLDITSDNGDNATVPAATASTAGLATAAQVAKLDGIAVGATSVNDASELTFTPAGGNPATDVQAAITNNTNDIASLTASSSADNFITTEASPTAGLGINGDYHLNAATGAVTGPKSGGAWPADGNVAANVFGGLGLGDATLSDTLNGNGGTATTAARSDHRHAQLVSATYPNVDGSQGSLFQLSGHATDPDGFYRTDLSNWIQVG